MSMFLLAMMSLANAEDPTFVGAEKPPTEEVKPEAKLGAELGGSLTTGNSDFYQISAGLNGSYKWDKNKLGLVAGALLGSGRVDSDGSGALNGVERTSDRVRNAQRVFGDARYDRFFGEKNSLYALAGAFHDPFAGYDLRSHEQLGFSRVLVKNDDTSWVVEVGADYAQENYVSGVDPGYQDIFAARVMTAFSHKFSESVGFQDTLEIYENVLEFEDMRILNSASISSKLSNKLSLKLSHTLIFDNVPVEGFQKLDQTTMATFVASIL